MQNAVLAQSKTSRCYKHDLRDSLEWLGSSSLMSLLDKGSQWGLFVPEMESSCWSVGKTWLLCLYLQGKYYDIKRQGARVCHWQLGIEEQLDSVFLFLPCASCLFAQVEFKGFAFDIVHLNASLCNLQYKRAKMHRGIRGKFSFFLLVDLLILLSIDI